MLTVVGPNLSGSAGAYTLLMLASSPVFAASYLMTKALTRTETTGVIVLWQAITVSLFSLPLAWWFWQSPTLWQWLGFLVAGLIGAVGHYCLTRAFSVADISASQSIKFLDLVWASLMGWLVFSQTPSRFTLIGGTMICLATVWNGVRETRARARVGLASGAGAVLQSRDRRSTADCRVPSFLAKQNRTTPWSNPSP